MKKPTLDPSSLASDAKPKRSPLFVWMQQNHDTLMGVLSGDMRPDWKSIAGKLAAAELTDADGNAPTPQCARQTWWKVRKAVEAKNAAPPAKGRPGPARPPAPASSTRPPGRPAQTADDVRALLSPGLPTPKPIFE